ncbi:hypothetical protein [Halomonas maura]|uniref:hypothetical protein n=1 Tax=Halomonas maura TaxID=117606 RepID=UPI0025B2F9B1|nr:hypothetical protein [Halomonas maura]MDN3555050.1 hypothetical protein [Halomonas maura]
MTPAGQALEASSPAIALDLDGTGRRARVDASLSPWQSPRGVGGHRGDRYARVNVFCFGAFHLAVVESSLFVIVVLALVEMRVNGNLERSAGLTVLSCAGLSALFHR